MYLLVVFLPLAAALLTLSFGRFLGRQGACIITTGSVATSAFLSLFIFYEVGLSGSVCLVDLAPWIDSSMLSIRWGFLFDSLTAVMLIVVNGVSSLVHVYSIGYMSADPHQPRFMSYLSLFTFFMLMLITADNFIQMFLGWEGVGLASFLLINFWYTRLQANKSAIKAMLVNRVGDFGLALGVMAIFYTFRTVDYATVFACAPSFAGTTFGFLNFEVDCLTCICLLLFVGAVGKSAQLGLHTWLPDAMEGPTPVSALIHAATMVTAGVFMIARCSPLFEYAPTSLVIVTLFGAMTAFFAGTTGLLQNDLKRVIAYSTCSQLGYMVFACGLSSYSVGVFHLANHAFFKALLFLSAGSVIHGLSDEQDMRRMGGLVRLLPFTYVMMLIGSMALIGFPFLTGFYSKDVILEVAYAHYSLNGNFAHWLGCTAVFFTSFYSFRLIYLTFLNDTNAYKAFIAHVHEAPFPMAFPLVVLSFGSIFIGYLTRDMFIGLGTEFWGNALFSLPQHISMIDAEFIPTTVKLIPLFFTLFGAVSAFFIMSSSMYQRIGYDLKRTKLGYQIYTFLSRKWHWDQVYNDYLVKNAFHFGYETSFKLLDKGIIETLGPFGLSTLFIGISRKVSQFQTGYIYHYVFIMLLSATFVMAFVSLDIISFLPGLNFEYRLAIIYLFLGSLFSSVNWM
jgi:proton-translocating NADH-quinone oxidoreductase chain L